MFGLLSEAFAACSVMLVSVQHDTFQSSPKLSGKMLTSADKHFDGTNVLF